MGSMYGWMAVAFISTAAGIATIIAELAEIIPALRGFSPTLVGFLVGFIAVVLWFRKHTKTRGPQQWSG